MIIARVLGATVLALAIAAVVVFVGNDRQTLVPPPDAVVESFVRELVSGRESRAIPYLAGSVSESVSAEELRRIEQTVEREVGHVGDVRAEADWSSGDRAEATGVWRGGEKEARRRFGLRRENGLWRIDRLPASGPTA
jgi:hypothetical protein